MRRFSFVALIALFIGLPFLMGPVSGPTTRTPRLTVTPGSTTVQDLTVNTTLTVTGTSSFTGAITAGDLSVTSCAGCGLPAFTSFSVTFATGCLNDPLMSLQVQPLVTGGPAVLIPMEGGGTISCTSDGIEMETVAGQVPLALRPFETQFFRGNVMSIAGVLTDICMVLRADGSIAYKTGVDCAGSPGNVAKTLDSGRQKRVIYQVQ